MRFFAQVIVWKIFVLSSWGDAIEVGSMDQSLDSTRQVYEYKIEQTWDSQPVENNPPITITLESCPDNEGLIINIRSRFFNDSGVPESPPGTPSWYISRFEVQYVS